MSMMTTHTAPGKAVVQPASEVVVRALLQGTVRVAPSQRKVRGSGRLAAEAVCCGNWVQIDQVLIVTVHCR